MDRRTCQETNRDQSGNGPLATTVLYEEISILGVFRGVCWKYCSDLRDVADPGHRRALCITTTAAF